MHQDTGSNPGSGKRFLLFHDLKHTAFLPCRNVQDSGHFLNIIRGLNLPKHSIIATLDVTSIYTNIPNNEGIEAVRTYLSKERDPKLNPTNNSICKLL